MHIPVYRVLLPAFFASQAMSRPRMHGVVVECDAVSAVSLVSAPYHPSARSHLNGSRLANLVVLEGETCQPREPAWPEPWLAATLFDSVTTCQSSWRSMIDGNSR